MEKTDFGPFEACKVKEISSMQTESLCLAGQCGVSHGTTYSDSLVDFFSLLEIVILSFLGNCLDNSWFYLLRRSLFPS